MYEQEAESRSIIKSDSGRRSESKQRTFENILRICGGGWKTYAMLEAAHIAKQQGIDVVAGYIEPHERPKTAALFERIRSYSYQRSNL